MTSRNIGSANVSGGVARTTYTIAGDETVGDYTLTGRYEENNTYEEATGTANFKVRIGTSITVANIIGSHGATSTFTATVKYNDVTPVNEGQVQFKLKGSIIGTGTVSNGTATVNYEIPSTIATGDEITANYLGTSTYGASVTTTAGTIKIRTNPTIILTNKSISYNEFEAFDYYVKIQDTNSNLIETGTVKLYINEYTITSYTFVANQGMKFRVPNAVINYINEGSNTIRAVYEQDDDYDTTDGTATLIARKSTTVVAPAISANAGGTATLEVTVYDNHNVIVTEGQVQFTDPNSQVSNIVVGANGKATKSVNIPANTTEGTTLIYSVKYSQTDNYDESSSVNLVITIRKGVVITVNDVTANRGDIVQLTASVKDLSNNNVDTGTITFTVDES